MDLTDVSSRLYHVLEMVGASEELRRRHQRTGTETELLQRLENNCHDQVDRKAFLCGSSFEGSVTPDLASDFDLIDCLGSCPVVTNNLDAPLSAAHLMVRDPWTFPGYVKLQSLLNRIPLTIDMLGTNKTWDIDYKGRIGGKKHLPPNPNGPAIMHIGRDGKHFLDHVPAYKYNGIPEFANAWITRRRFHGWPSEDMIERMKEMGCMVVGTGHPKSLEKFAEWRLSFTPQERLLMASLNPVQHKVYILLKMVKKNILEKAIEDLVLSSYHLKTCVLFAAELMPPHIWTPENLIGCLFRCLKLLTHWIRISYCPNFFVTELNMFTQERFMHQRAALLTQIELLINNGHTFLYRIQTDNIGEIMRSNDTEPFRNLAEIKINSRIYQLNCVCLKGVVRTYTAMLRGSKQGADMLECLKETLATFGSTERFDDFTPEETRTVIGYMVPWLHLHLAKAEACRAFVCQEESESKRLLDAAGAELLLAKGADLVNVRLARAFILLRAGDYEEIKRLHHILQEIENDLTNRVRTMCYCVRREIGMFFWNEHEMNQHYEKMRNMTIHNLMSSSMVTCVIFPPFEAEVVPQPLKYEMYRSVGTRSGTRDEFFHFWFDFAVVEAKAFLHFLQYLVAARLQKEATKQVAIDNLLALTCGEGAGHMETTYNLLGWIMLQENRVHEAVRCFLQSWRIRPHHNAAKFHMINIYLMMSQQQR